MFDTLESLWGPFTVDCFATYYNKKVEKYYSRFWNPDTSGVDAFFQSWENDNCLLVPPVDLVSKTLKYMEKELAFGTLVVPDWPSSVFWPLLWRHFEHKIVDWKRFKGKDVLIHGRNTNSVLGSPDWEGHVYAVCLDFRR